MRFPRLIIAHPIKPICLALLLGSVGRLIAGGEQPKDMDIYLLIGQSNMAGRATYTEAESQAIDGCFLMTYDQTWVPASNPLNRYSTIRKEYAGQKMNPGYQFCLEMRKAAPGQKIGLVVNARGGSSVEEWAKGGSFYKEAVRRALEAEKFGTLRGILWHQGEANQNDPDYLEKIASLIQDLRQDLNSLKLPFVAGQINRSDDYLFNQLILELPRKVGHTAVVGSEGLTATDKWHFDSRSMRILGARYAEKIQELQSKTESSPNR